MDSRPPDSFLPVRVSYIDKTAAVKSVMSRDAVLDHLPREGEEFVLGVGGHRMRFRTSTVSSSSDGKLAAVFAELLGPE